VEEEEEVSSPLPLRLRLPRCGIIAAPHLHRDVLIDASYYAQVNLDEMTDMERLEFELQRAQAAVAGLHTPVMQGAYQRHIEELQTRIKEEREYLLRIKEEHETLLQEEDLTQVRADSAPHRRG